MYAFAVNACSNASQLTALCGNGKIGVYAAEVCGIDLACGERKGERAARIAAFRCLKRVDDGSGDLDYCSLTGVLPVFRCVNSFNFARIQKDMCVVICVFGTVYNRVSVRVKAVIKLELVSGRMFISPSCVGSVMVLAG